MRFSPYVFLTAFLAFFSLSACSGPVSVTTNYAPPGTPGGRLCINQCREARDYCRKDCELDQRRCTNAMQTQAIRDYEAYSREQFMAHAPLELQPRDFERPETCVPSKCNDNCERPYQKCYEACGGKVTTSSSCHFLCF